MRIFFVFIATLYRLHAFPSICLYQGQKVKHFACSSSSSTTDESGNGALNDGSHQPLTSVLNSRLPTSVDDQVRQAADSIKRASNGVEDNDGITPYHRHTVRLLLPVIGATELDDWPGGARQMMEAAEPLVEQILQHITDSAPGTGGLVLQKVLLDPSDGVAAFVALAKSANDDSCTVLLPTAETIPKLKDLEEQVGPKRNLILVNPQWKRRSDFGGSFGSLTFGGRGKQSNTNADYAEQFVPTFSLTNLICEGESIRILRTYPGPWRVFVRTVNEERCDWVLLGFKDFENNKPVDWERRAENQRDGGKLFDYGQPTYQDIIEMLHSSPNYKPKNPAERAAAAFEFIKDSL